MLTDNMKGALFMSASMAGFAFNDAAVKLSASEIGIYQSIFVRGLFAVTMIGFFAWANGAFKTIPGRGDLTKIGWRSFWEVGATLAFLTALFHMPIANITAIMQLLPFTVTIAAALFLSEKFGWMRGLAIAIGFAGAMLIIKPGSEEFSFYSLLGVVAVICVTFRDLIVRRISKTVPSLFVAFCTSVVITLSGGIAMFFDGGWQPVSLRETGFLFIAALFIFAGYYYSVAAMRFGEVAAVTPFRYSIMIWAILLGWVIWGDIPDLWTWIGMAIVVGMGMFTLWRERVV